MGKIWVAGKDDRGVGVHGRGPSCEGGWYRSDGTGDSQPGIKVPDLTSREGRTAGEHWPSVVFERTECSELFINCFSLSRKALRTKCKYVLSIMCFL